MKGMAVELIMILLLLVIIYELINSLVYSRNILNLVQLKEKIRVVVNDLNLAIRSQHFQRILNHVKYRGSIIKILFNFPEQLYF